MDDVRYMRRALELARHSVGRVSPRPPVGAVIVSPAGEVLAEGWCKDGPGLHAEMEALAAAEASTEGATCYVTLEPCLKRCAPALIAAGVRRVVAATTDPNPNVDGGGIALLKEAGVEVVVGVAEEDARRLIEPFAKWITTGRPFVTLKLAATLDGKIAAPDRTARWISGEASRAQVHELRRVVDAVLVGSGTVVADDPALTARAAMTGDDRQPLRVVVDSSGRVPARTKILDGTAPALVVTTSDAPRDVVAMWRERGADVAVVPRMEAGADLNTALEELGRRDVCHLLVEGGPTIAASFLDLGLIDRLRLYLAPKVIGGEAPGLFAVGAKTLGDAWPLVIDSVQRVGEDIRVDARPRTT